eukprot:gnl/MRDRNA2_/MRDRNA2_102804_c0_seq1.p1 gnl/MRDRNA2_/MRDRNA2_102804_c0~~gnl/MRDRNA2_/MRDRNA2_102804_c0_seq1.p1  ORF type:complete len:481 (+),score=71.87 gnl/MRDRNA2_/MRDRNA2_102804_c0_seq1:166-1608(+)
MSLTARGPADITTGPAVSLFALLVDKLADSKVTASDSFTCARCGEAIAPRCLKGDFRSPRPTAGASAFEKGEPSMVTVSNPLGVAVSLVTLQPSSNVHLERSSSFENSWFQGYLSARVACPSQRCRETLGWALACGSRSSSKRTPRGKQGSLFAVDPTKRPIVFTCAEDLHPPLPPTPRSNVAPHLRCGGRRRSAADSQDAEYSHAERSMTLGEIAAKAKEVELKSHCFELPKPSAEVQPVAVISPAREHCETDTADAISEASAISNSKNVRMTRRCEEAACSNHYNINMIRRSEEAVVPVTCKSNRSVIDGCESRINPGTSENQVEPAASAYRSCKSTESSVDLCTKLFPECDGPGRSANREQVAKPSSRSCKLKEPLIHSGMKASAKCHIKDAAKLMNREQFEPTTPRPQVLPPEAPRNLPRPRHFNPSRDLLLRRMPLSAGGSTLKQRSAGVSMSWLPSPSSSADAPPARPAVQSAR